MTHGQRVLADHLFRIGGIKFGAFRLKLHEKNPEAPLSPIYVDLWVLRSNPDAMDVAVCVFQEMIQSLEFDLLADVPTAATPIVAILMYKTRVPMVTPRELKTHGAGANIDGAFRPGQVAVVIDDLVTKADSKLNAINVLEAGGLKVRDVVVLVDREQGGAAAARSWLQSPYRLHAPRAPRLLPRPEHNSVRALRRSDGVPRREVGPVVTTTLGGRTCQKRVRSLSLQ